MNRVSAIVIWIALLVALATSTKSRGITLAKEALMSFAGFAPAVGYLRVNSKDSLKYVWIPAGTFQMGCSAGDARCTDDEKPSHQVKISKGFWMGQTEVTVGAYKQFAKATGKPMPSEIHIKGGWNNEALPMVALAWADAQAYCSWAGGRLPTEAEWEYAARGSSEAARYGPLNEIAWFEGNSGEEALEVGKKRPNGFRLFDTLGNVWEWVSDWYQGDYYYESPSSDPEGPSSGRFRVLRGGSWNTRERDVRVSYRLRGEEDTQSYNVGVRCVGELGTP